MMRFNVTSLFFLLFAIQNTGAQGYITNDTIELEAVSVTARSFKYQAGSKLISIDTTSLELLGGGTLENLLARYTSIYLKSNAGSLSTVRFRGMSPDHTSVYFGGININSLTLGHSNFSKIPVYLFNKVDLQFGSASAVNGSGSIGGSIYLSSSPKWDHYFAKEIRLSAGSFGEKLIGGKLSVGNGKIESKTYMFLFDKKNDFTFTNTQYRDFLTHTFERADTQKFAAIRNIGLIQEVNYRFNNTSYISSKTWLQKDWHQLQPNMASNLTIKGATVLENHHIRTWTEYVKLFESWDLNIGGGYVRDYQLYNKNLLQVVGTNRFIGKFEVNREFGRQGDKNKHSIRAGGNVKHISPFVYAYNKATIRYEQHVDLYFLYLYNPFKPLKITANLRQMFVTDFKAPFTPSLGLKFILYNNVSNSLSIQSNVSRFYRVPTFNDRFWGDQGNPGLLPEDGMHYETGLSYFHCTRNWQSEFRVNGFYMLVDNWILWIQKWSEELQRTDWLAENVLQVESKGMELYSSNTIKYGGFRFKFGGGYTYNPVVKKSSLTSSDAINRQLAHVPENTANAWLDINRKSTSVIVDHAFIGERYEDDSDGKLEGYALFNLAMRQAVNIKSHQFKIIGGIQNILNTSYQHQQNYAMPGRSFKISIIYN